MKSAIILCVIGLALEAYTLDVAEIYTSCKEETGFKGELRDIKVEGADKVDKCFLKCVAEKKKVLKSDGTLDLEQVKIYFSNMKEMAADFKEKLIKGFEECSKEVKPDPSDLCETAYKYFQCKKGKLVKKD